MNRRIEYKISPQDEGREILAFLKMQGFSRHLLTEMKANPQAILLNGERGFGRTRLCCGDLLKITVLEQKPSEKILPLPQPFEILYEDQDILVVNKSASMPVHPSMGNYENTLANGVAWHYRDSLPEFVFRCINRLDRDTSGVVLLANNPLSGAILSDAMKKRQIRRTYLAIVTGLLPQKGIIDAPIARMPGSTMERCIDLIHGERAVTYYERLDTFAGQQYSLAEIHLETGRTHQIRVHMKAIGHPLPGDYLYHPDDSLFSHQPLHSYQLEFVHPITKQNMCFTAPFPHF